MAVSDTPWSKFSAADYSVEQWHRACIAHTHDGPATSKNECKLPVREPDGTLNRAGVHAAAAALAGARGGGVKLSVSEKIAATKQMAGYYKQLGEKPPKPKVPAFLKHDQIITPNEFREALGLKHAIDMSRTVDDVIAGMTSEQYDLMTLIVGAAVDDINISDFPEIQQEYDALSVEHKNVIDFIVGGLLAEDSVLKHQDKVDEFLAHFGVKGQKWGVVKYIKGAIGVESSSGLSTSRSNTPGGREKARAAVKAGTATLGQAHLAGLKSTGHRATNLFLGDKTYWKRIAVVGGITATGVAAAVFVPGVLPAAVLAAVASNSFAAGVAGTHVVAGTSLTTSAAIGAATLTKLGVGASFAISSIATGAARKSNTVRALTGNSQINKSYAALGSAIKRRQTAGTERVQKILNQSGSIRKKDLQHKEEVSVINVDDFLAGHGVSLTHSVSERTVDDVVEDFLAHHGVKGQRWGIRRKRDSGGTDGSSEKDGDGSGGSGGKGGGGKSSGGTHLSADAERFIKTQGKKGHEMSDREINEANKRADAVKKYNDIFGPNPNQELQNKVNAMRLEQEYRTIKAELHPSKLARVGKLVKMSAPLFPVVQQLASSPGGKKIQKDLTTALFSTASPRPARTGPINTGAPRQSPFTSTGGRHRQSRVNINDLSTTLGSGKHKLGNPTSYSGPKSGKGYRIGKKGNLITN